jgi:hypothetical protein
LVSVEAKSVRSDDGFLAERTMTIRDKAGKTRLPAWFGERALTQARW